MRIGFLLGDVNQIPRGDLGGPGPGQRAIVANCHGGKLSSKDVNASGTLTLADKGITNGNLTKALPRREAGQEAGAIERQAQSALEPPAVTGSSKG